MGAQVWKLEIILIIFVVYYYKLSLLFWLTTVLCTHLYTMILVET